MNANGDRGSSVPVETFENVIYTINITIGSPPQMIEAAIDTFGNYLVVASSEFDDRWHQPPTHVYNSSLSSTYTPDGEGMSILWGDYNYGGFISSDVVRVGSMALQNYEFEEFTSATCIAVGCFRNGFDAIVGLAPPWNKMPWYGSPKPYPNLLSYITAQIELDEDLFALHLPGPSTPPGSLTFGGYNSSLIENELIRIPLYNQSAIEWVFPITHLELDTSHPLHTSLPRHSQAFIDSAQPFVVLPTAFALNFTTIIGAVPGPGWYWNVPCSSRAYLPDLTIGLGRDGHNFTLTAFEYTTETDMGQVGMVCLVNVWPRKWFGGTEDTVLLGAPFLRAVMGVFDFGRREVGLGQLKRV